MEVTTQARAARLMGSCRTPSLNGPPPKSLCFHTRIMTGMPSAQPTPAVSTYMNKTDDNNNYSGEYGSHIENVMVTSTWQIPIRGSDSSMQLHSRNLEVELKARSHVASQLAESSAATVWGPKHRGWLRRAHESHSPRDEMEPMAWNAATDQSMGRPSRNASAVMAQTALVGVCVRGFSCAHTLCSGTPPSREKLHSILLI